MLLDLRRGLVALLALTVVVGIGYPMLVFGIGQAAFRGAADGSPVRSRGRVVGSALIGQSFGTDPKWFWGRPSAAGAGYDPGASGASNLGSTSAELDREVRERLDVLLKANPGTTAAQVPAELVTASASGLDPHISPAAADFQVNRVARARGLDPAEVSRLVDRHVRGRTLGIFGEPRVNVLELNLALDRLR
ncbi:MAG TPA: potassium-transporting ATPase subunit KdpC [Actinomycetes bacterium]|jgi:K+-transporting ATPase ATPase C chain|nr:potassium-transporting ATPase subunit KdpC [Actinomycetes bacterium]